MPQPEPDPHDQLRDRIKELLHRFHSRACYPEAMETELDQAADEIIGTIDMFT